MINEQSPATNITPECDPRTRQELLGPVAAAQLGSHCLVEANRLGHINQETLDPLPLCVGVCGLAGQIDRS